MTLTPQLIAPFQSGLNTDMSPWLAPADSFSIASNVHVRHGQLQKRSGYSLFGTLSGGTRVMGISRYVQDDGTKSTLAFDTTRAYLYSSGTLVFTILDSAAIMGSGEFDYVWAVNWQSSNLANRLYFTNGLPYDGVSVDGILYYPGTGGATTTTRITPSTGGGNTLYGGKLLFTLGQRLLVLYTYENNGASTSSHPQRARWCAKQDVTNWDDTVPGGGDFADAATGDQIISAQALQNQIIVYFTNSVWTILPTPDPNKAFRWVRLNHYRACDGKMASVSYDRYTVSLGVRGIMATDGSTTRRIDERIQDFTNNEINVSQFGKVFCQRSYENQRWWTLYAGGEVAENDHALIYDDDSKAFTTYNISLNCLGYGNAARDYSLDEFTSANNLDFSLADMGEDTLQDWYWDEGEDILLGGDTSGNVYQLDTTAQDIDADIDAEFFTASWNPFQQEGKEAQMSYIDLYVETDKATQGTIDFYKNDEVDPYVSRAFDLMPNLDFRVLVSQIEKTNPCLVTAGDHGLSTGDTIFIYGVLGMTLINSGNGYTVTVVNDNQFTLDGVDATAAAYAAYTGGGSVYDREFYQTRTWIRVFGGGIGYLHRVKVSIFGGDAPFILHALKPSFRAIGTRTVN